MGPPDRRPVLDDGRHIVPAQRHVDPEALDDAPGPGAAALAGVGELAQERLVRRIVQVGQQVHADPGGRA